MREGRMENMAYLDHWQEAQDRVLLYLKKLGMPAMLSLELAREALRQAADEASAAGHLRPTQLAMRTLHRILAQNSEALEKTTLKEYSILYRRWHPEAADSASCKVRDPGTGMEAAASPPIARASMSIKRI